MTPRDVSEKNGAHSEEKGLEGRQKGVKRQQKCIEKSMLEKGLEKDATATEKRVIFGTKNLSIFV